MVESFKKGLRPFFYLGSKLLKTEQVQFCGIIATVILIIVLRGPDQNEAGLLGTVVQHYVQETTSLLNTTADAAVLSDISSLSSSPVGKPNVAYTLDPLTIQEKYVQASEPASTNYLEGFKADQVVEYTVQGGDSISSIAADFDVSVNTIIWANNLKNPNVLSLGQTLKIPPVTGVIHTVKKGDTIASIAKKYGADTQKILAFNDIQDGSGLEAGAEVIVPGGSMPLPSVKLIAPSTRSSSIYVAVGDGQCVAFVQAHGFAGFHGNAYQWKAYVNSQIPAAGEVVVLRGGRYGHVALITAVKDSGIQIVEQNYYGPYVVDHRQISFSDPSIVGFVSQ